MHRTGRVVLLEKVTSEYRPKRGERVSLVKCRGAQHHRSGKEVGNEVREVGTRGTE